MSSPFDYLRDPEAIYQKSFSIIRSEVDLSRFPKEMHPVLIRLVHACGMTDLGDDLAFSDDAVAAGIGALKKGAPIIVDAQMVAHGIIKAHLPAENTVICSLNDPQTAPLSQKLATTRSAAQVELWHDALAGSIVAIGNAPTALFYLLEKIVQGGPKPALILGFSVGFVGASESKQALIENCSSVPFIAVKVFFFI